MKATLLHLQINLLSLFKIELRQTGHTFGSSLVLGIIHKKRKNHEKAVCLDYRMNDFLNDLPQELTIV